MRVDNIFLKNLTKRTNFEICKCKIGDVEFLICEEDFEKFSLCNIFLLREEKLVESFFATEICVEDDGFFANRIFFDSFGHCDKVRYFCENGDIFREICEQKTTKICQKFDELIPVYFFESVLCENFDEAKTYLSKDLQREDCFFEQFEKFSHLIFEKGKYFALANGIRKEIKFEMDNQRIKNIFL